MIIPNADVLQSMKATVAQAHLLVNRNPVELNALLQAPETAEAFQKRTFKMMRQSGKSVAAHQYFECVYQLTAFYRCQMHEVRDNVIQEILAGGLNPEPATLTLIPVAQNA